MKKAKYLKCPHCNAIAYGYDERCLYCHTPLVVISTEEYVMKSKEALRKAAEKK